MMDQKAGQIPFPSAWIGQLKPLLGVELPAFLDCLEMDPVRGLRTRRGLPPPADAEDPVPWAENAWYLPLASQAGAHPAHEAGAYYLQEPSAMAAAAALRPRPGDRVLDLCAAPGGKSTQLAAYMGGRGCWCATSRCRPGRRSSPGTSSAWACPTPWQSAPCRKN